MKFLGRFMDYMRFPPRARDPSNSRWTDWLATSWAKQDTGFDPIAALRAAQSGKSSSAAGTATSPAPQSAGAKGAAGGAIAGDPGKGAAIGAAGGGIRGRMAQKRAQARGTTKGTTTIAAAGATGSG